MTAADGARRSRRLLPFILGLLLAGILATVAGRIWPDSTGLEALRLGILAGSLAAAIAATVEAVRAGREARKAYAALERSEDNLRAFLAARSPAERAMLAEQLPAFRRFMQGEGRE